MSMTPVPPTLFPILPEPFREPRVIYEKSILAGVVLLVTAILMIEFQTYHPCRIYFDSSSTPGESSNPFSSIHGAEGRRVRPSRQEDYFSLVTSPNY